MAGIVGSVRGKKRERAGGNLLSDDRITYWESNTVSTLALLPPFFFLLAASASRLPRIAISFVNGGGAGGHDS